MGKNCKSCKNNNNCEQKDNCNTLTDNTFENSNENSNCDKYRECECTEPKCGCDNCGDNTSISRNGVGGACSILQQAGLHTVKEGYLTLAKGFASHAEGSGVCDIVDFLDSYAKEDISGREGSVFNIAHGIGAHVEGCGTVAYGNHAHAEGGGTQAVGDGSHAEGIGNKASGIASHAEGDPTLAQGDASHAEGKGSHALGCASHAEGNGDGDFKTMATGTGSHAEGDACGANIIAQGDGSHAQGSTLEGQICASGEGSHASGTGTLASGNFSQATGCKTMATGKCSFAQGTHTVATSNNSSTFGIDATTSFQSEIAISGGGFNSQLGSSQSMFIQMRGSKTILEKPDSDIIRINLTLDADIATSNSSRLIVPASHYWYVKTRITYIVNDAFSGGATDFCQTIAHNNCTFDGETLWPISINNPYTLISPPVSIAQPKFEINPNSDILNGSIDTSQTAFYYGPDSDNGEIDLYLTLDVASISDTYFENKSTIIKATASVMITQVGF